MRVLWATDRDPWHPRGGGAEKTTYMVTKGLVSRGHQVVVLCGGMRGGDRRFFDNGVEYHRVALGVGVRAVLPVELRSRDFDFIIDDLAHVIPWFSPKLSSTLGAAFFRHLHARTLDGQVASPFSSLLKRVELTYSRIYRDWRFVTESEQSVSDLAALGVSRQAISRVPPGVDSDLYHPREKFPQPTFVYFAGLKKYKRPAHAIEAAARVRKQTATFRLIVLGVGPELDHLKQMAHDLGLEGIVSFPGRLPEEELARLVSKCWMNIHLSVAEGWGLSILEAAACGTPTIGYRAPGVEEAIEDGRTGILVPNGDVERLSSAMIDGLTVREEFRNNCRNRALSFPWDTTVSGWEKVIRGLANA